MRASVKNLAEAFCYLEKELAIRLDDKNKELTYNFYQFLHEENQKFNLTRLDDEEKFANFHFLDTAFLYFVLKSSPQVKRNIESLGRLNYLDVGSGGGIPGFLLYILENNSPTAQRVFSKITLSESIGKKALFLQKLQSKFALESSLDLKIVQTRAESLSESFDLITARAVYKPSKALELTKLLKKEGFYFAQLSKDLSGEESYIKKIGRYKLKIVQRFSYSICEKPRIIKIIGLK